jgi:hypothetical protein
VTAGTELDRTVIRDVFPAAVVVGDRVYRSALAVITRDRLLVYLTRAAPILDAPYDPATSTVPALTSGRFAPAHLTLTSGQVATVTGQRGCGCGNPLKGWRPWTPYRKAPA